MPLMRTRTVLIELREQSERTERALREQSERTERAFIRCEREFELNRRAYREGMELCARLVERSAVAFDENARALDELRAEVHELHTAVEEHSRVIAEVPVALRALVDVVNELCTEVRAQTKAIFQLVDRFDRFDPGQAAA
jgi:methyl-accepting chemotaxis protein